MALRLARLMEAASVKEAIRATPRNAKSPGIILLVSSLSGVGCQLNDARRRDRCLCFDPVCLFPRGKQCAASFFLLLLLRSSRGLGCCARPCTRLNRTTIDRPTDTRVERHFNERARQRYNERSRLGLPLTVGWPRLRHTTRDAPSGRSLQRLS